MIMVIKDTVVNENGFILVSECYSVEVPIANIALEMTKNKSMLLKLWVSIIWRKYVHSFFCNKWINKSVLNKYHNSWNEATWSFKSLCENVLQLIVGGDGEGVESLLTYPTVSYIIQTKPIQNKHKSLQNQKLTKIRETVIWTKPVQVPNKIITLLCTKNMPYVCNKI